MLRQLPSEVLLASGYAVFLLVAATVLEKLAKHSHRRGDQYELAGFRYHPGFDRWECPAGNHLVRVDTDPMQRVVRYRARASDCNGCPKKTDCTDSDTGREIERHLDLWLRTGLSQFHRGLSFALIVLAALLLLVEAVRFPEGRSLVTLGSLFIFVAFCGVKLFLPSHPGQTTTTELRE